MDYLKFKTDESTIKLIMDFYDAKEIKDEKRPYDIFATETHDKIKINGYKTSSKDLFTVVFAGNLEKIKIEAKIFFKEIPEPVKQNKVNAKWEDLSYQIGSDEVGVGDFFLGMYICATFLTPDDVKFVESLGVKDSKKLNDSKIEEIGQKLLDHKIKKHVVKITPLKMDELDKLGYSTHMMLATAHNFAHKKLIEKYHIKDTVPVYIDQFEKEGIYRRYCKDQIISSPLIFHTSGESYYPSVATSSILARFYFLQDWRQMEAELGMTIPKGAGAKVDLVYNKLIKKYGKEYLDPYVKHLFRNYKDIN